MGEIEIVTKELTEDRRMEEKGGKKLTERWRNQKWRERLKQR